MLVPPSIASFQLFGFDVRFYGLMLFLGMGMGICAVYFIAKKYYKTLNPDILLDIFPWLIIVSIISARLYYVLLNLDFYLKYKSEILAIRHGGISIHGAILGGLVFGILYLKYYKKAPVLPYADVMSFGVAIGQCVGRWGNFFNQEAFGIPCNLPWKMYIEPAFRPKNFSSFEYFHPTFLYESIWDFLIFLILFFGIRRIKIKGKTPDGLVFFGYLALYSIGRFFIEGIRTDSALDILGVPIAQIVSFVMFLAALIGIVFLCYRSACLTRS